MGDQIAERSRLRSRAFFQDEQHSLLALYNFLGGGGVSRAGILALGVLPHFQARRYLGFARRAFPSLWWLTNDARTKRNVVRVATIGCAAVQAFGFARFLQDFRAPSLSRGSTLSAGPCCCSPAGSLLSVDSLK